MRSSIIVRFRLRYISLISVSVFALILVIFGCSLLLHGFKNAPFRQAFVITTDPMRIISWDTSQTALQVVSLPSDILIQGALGYGEYSLSAMKTLDAMDHKNGELLRQSLAQSIGVPITGVVILDSNVPKKASDLESLKILFSWRSILLRLFGRIGTTISFADWIHSVFVVHAINSDDIKLSDLSLAVSDTVRADGTTVHVLDTQKVDYILATALHDAKLRTENKTVTVINTTSVLGIGSNVARMISRFGIQVVTVGNEADAIGTCQLQTDQKMKQSLTYQFLKSYFGCTEKLKKPDGEVSDITLRIGTAYASLFESNN